MAHNIHSMVYAGDRPWHGLGVHLPANGRWEDIREAAGFYRATEMNVHLADGRVVPDRKAIIREDNGAYLSTVGRTYEIVQFNELAEAGVIASGDVEALWHTAGTLGEHGARGWLLGELPEPIRVRGDESEIRKFILLTTAHDGSSSAVLANCATRVVCQNTLGTALREKDGARWSIRHTKNAKLRLDSAARAFRNLVTNFEKFGELANMMAGARFTLRQHQATIDRVIPLPDDDKKHPRLISQREKLGALYETFIGGGSIRGTAWGAFQAWTQFADHVRPSFGDAPDSLSRKFESVTVGSASDLKAQALSAILNELNSPSNGLELVAA